MLAMLYDVLEVAIGIAFLLGVLSTIGAVFFFRRSRRDTYWRQRRNASRRGLRASIVAFACFTASAIACVMSATVSMIDTEPEVPATVIAATLVVQAQTSEPIVQVSETTSEAPTAQATQTVVPTTTPSPQPPTHTPTPIPPQTNAVLTIWAIDDAIDADWQPPAPKQSFTAGIARLYFYVNYTDVDEGAMWHKTLLRDGEIINEHSQVWTLDADEGETFFFFGASEGFPPGNYTVELRVDSSLVASSEFTITEAQ